MTLRYRKLDDSLLSNLRKLDFTDDNGDDTERLQWFIRKRALNHHNQCLGITHVILDEVIPIGYITLATASFHKKEVSEDKRPVTSGTSQVSATIIEYFAIDKPKRRKGLGSEVLLWSIGIGRRIARTVGCRYVILSAEVAKGFYIKEGFKISETEENNKMMYKDLFPELHGR